MKYFAMKIQPQPKQKIHALKFQIHVNEKHLAGLLLILLGVILLQFI